MLKQIIFQNTDLMTILSSELLLNSLLQFTRLRFRGYGKRLVTSSPIVKRVRTL